jgi:hypothetical protein
MEINDLTQINFGQTVEVKRKFREYRPKGSLLDSLIPKRVPNH